MGDSQFLEIAGVLNFLVAILHLMIIFGGVKWYRFFGAGESMTVMAEKRSLIPKAVTLFIASVFTIFGIYAWSGAGIVPGLPFLKPILIMITGIYFIRGIGGLIAPFITTHRAIKQNSLGFWVISSLTCVIIAIVHLLGVVG